MLKDFLFRGSLQLLNFSKYTIIWSQIELLEYILKSETQIVTRLNVIKLFLTWSVNLDKEFISLKYFLTCASYLLAILRTLDRRRGFRVTIEIVQSCFQIIDCGSCSTSYRHQPLSFFCKENMKDNLFIVRNILHFGRR